jgi:ceroid-lipofuscinosis MFS transporter 7
MAVEKYLVALTIVGLVDAISYMLVTPSLVFYVLQNGGTHTYYGIIMSAFSFSSFCTKPFIGWWSDNQGFRLPYIASVSTAMLGGVVYVFASALPKGNVAVGAILASRLLGGCGAANSALGFAYVARSVPQSKQTSTNSLLSLCRILGMAIGPGLNIMVARVDIPISDNWGLDSLNSVGIVLVIANLISAGVIFFLLEEPNEEDSGSFTDEKNDANKDNDDGEATTTSPLSSTAKSDAFRSFLSMDILVPMFSIFSFNSNFQLIETGFAPAANDALGWGPIESSAALGSLSFLIAINMFSVMQLSKRGISDSNMLCGGLISSIVAYTALYLLWIKDSTLWNLYLPIVLASSGFPYMMATTRSLFTVSVNAKPALRPYHGFMQAVLSMAASVAGFTTPGVVAAYMLRSPEEVLASSDLRELTPLSLFAPVLSGLALLGVVYLRLTGAMFENKNDAKELEDGGSLSEFATTTDEEKTLDKESSQTESSSLLPRHSQLKKRPGQKRRSSNLAIMLEGNFDGLFEDSLKESIRT